MPRTKGGGFVSEWDALDAITKERLATCEKEERANILPNGNEFRESLSILVVLIVGFWFISGFIPFDSILTQAGFPASQTWLNAFGMCSNLVLNALLIPVYGAVGAAIATVSSFILAMIYLNVMVRKR